LSSSSIPCLLHIEDCHRNSQQRQVTGAASSPLASQTGSTPGMQEDLRMGMMGMRQLLLVSHPRFGWFNPHITRMKPIWILNWYNFYSFNQWNPPLFLDSTILNHGFRVNSTKFRCFRSGLAAKQAQGSSRGGVRPARCASRAKSAGKAVRWSLSTWQFIGILAGR
jgi:hypothetical protein